MAAPREVIDLVKRFERNHDTHRSHEYSETETRREFIDPFSASAVIFPPISSPFINNTWQVIPIVVV